MAKAEKPCGCTHTHTHTHTLVVLEAEKKNKKLRDVKRKFTSICNRREMWGGSRLFGVRYFRRTMAARPILLRPPHPVNFPLLC